jgi:hypothetical protein
MMQPAPLAKIALVLASELDKQSPALRIDEGAMDAIAKLGPRRLPG